MIVIHELGLADRVERVRTVVAPTKVNDALLADNPLSKLPTLVLEDGFSLFDSRVIVEYLDGLHTGPALIPDASRARMVALRDQALGDGIMDVALLWLIERQRGEAGQSEPLVNAYRAKLAASLARLEGDAGALAGRTFDVGHLTLGTALGYLDFRFPAEAWRADHPALAAWHAGFLRRPSALANPVVDDS